MATSLPSTATGNSYAYYPVANIIAHIDRYSNFLAKRVGKKGATNFKGSFQYIFFTAWFEDRHQKWL